VARRPLLDPILRPSHGELLILYNAYRGDPVQFFVQIEADRAPRRRIVAQISDLREFAGAFRKALGWYR
jgi:hypothetical protein